MLRVISNAISYADCDMHVSLTVEAGHFAYLMVTYDNTVDLTVKASPTNTPTQIKSNYESITFVQNSTEDGPVFAIDKFLGTTYNVSFDLRYYVPDNGTDGYSNTDNCASGAYIFKPTAGTNSSLRFSTL
jgi:hypothetical protein